MPLASFLVQRSLRCEGKPSTPLVCPRPPINHASWHGRNVSWRRHFFSFQRSSRRGLYLQIDVVGSELLNRLLGQWGLMHQLTILRNVFLLGCPLLVPFASCFVQ